MHVQTGSTFNFVRSHSEKTNSKLPALIFGRVNFLKKKKKKVQNKAGNNIHPSTEVYHTHT